MIAFGEAEITFVRELAKEAGLRALEMLTDISPEFKADESYVTHIDRETETFLHQRLAARFPDWAFQGEEYGRAELPDALGNAASENNRRGSEPGIDGVPLWCVDPIDGTTNMVFGLPLWCVAIGLVDGGEAVAGALYLPRTGELFWGVRGQGAFCNGVRLQAKDRETLHVEDTLGFTSSSCRQLDIQAVTGRIRCLGSVATETIYAAKGALCCHVGIHEGLNDLAGALCIALEAGCVVQYLNGEPVSIPDMVREGRTRRAFTIAPPRLTALLQSRLPLPVSRS